MNFFCHCRGQYPGIRPRICGHFLFVQFLRNAQRLVRADFKTFGAVILQFCQIIQKRRVLRLLFSLYRLHRRDCRRLFRQMGNQFLCRPLLLKPVLLIQKRRIKIFRPFHGFPFAVKKLPFGFHPCHHAVKRRLHKIPDFPLPVHHHPKHAGHHPAHGNHRTVRLQIGFYGIPVFQRKHTGKIDSHQIILFGPQICSRTKIVIGGQIFCFPYPPQNLFLRLGINPYPFAYLARDMCLLLHQTVNILPFPSGVGADIDDLHIRPVQKPADGFKLFSHVIYHFVLKFFRNERQGSQRPAFQFLVIDLRVTHSHQMTHAPSDHRIFRFHITVPVTHIQF